MPDAWGVSSLPTVNACLNASSAVLLVTGWAFIRNKKIRAHNLCMAAALCVSTLFLISYLTYHALHGSTRFPGTGPIRTVYLTILATHTVLAAAIVPMVLRTFWLATKERYEQHRRLARWTLPLWLYVSVTGVVVYWMLYRMSWQ